MFVQRLFGACKFICKVTRLWQPYKNTLVNAHCFLCEYGYLVVSLQTHCRLVADSMQSQCIKCANVKVYHRGCSADFLFLGNHWDDSFLPTTGTASEGALQGTFRSLVVRQLHYISDRWGRFVNNEEKKYNSRKIISVVIRKTCIFVTVSK